MLVIVDGPAGLDAPMSQQLRTFKGHVVALSFTQGGAGIDAITRLVESSGGALEVITGAGYLDQVSTTMGAKYLQLIADLPDRYHVGGKSLKEAVTFEDLSLWWLNEVSSKRSDLYPTFTRLCQLEVVGQVAEQTGASSLLLASSDAAFWDVVASFCRTAGIRLSSARPAARFGFWSKRFLDTVKVSAVLFRWMLRTAGQMAMAKLLVPTRAAKSSANGSLCVFHTLYPSLWQDATKGADSEVDEKYQQTPKLVRELGGMPTLYAGTLASDDSHQHLAMREYLRLCLYIRCHPEIGGVPFHLMDRDLRWLDLIPAYLRSLLAFRHLLLWRRCDFRRQWRMDGVDLYPLVEVELHQSASRIPRYLLHLQRMRRFLERTRPACLVTSHFEFGYGRAIVYAAKTSAPSPLIIGVEHGPSGRKLQARHNKSELDGHFEPPPDFIHSVPLPDAFFLEGEEGRQLLLDAGLPSDRLHVLGAPRVNRLASVRTRSEAQPRVGGEALRVLTTFGQHDGLQILQICMPVLKSVPGYHFIIKTHPRSELHGEAVERQLGGIGGESTYEVTAGNFYDQLGFADVVIATYSSTALEAAALGYPLVCLHLPDFVSPSGLLDTDFGVKWAANAEELAKALKENSESPVTNPHVDEIEQYFFTKLDGQADHRWAQEIIRLTEEHLEAASQG